MQTDRKKFRKRPFQIPCDKTLRSVTLRQIGEHIQKRDYAEGLSKANQALADSSLAEPEQSRVLALVADSEFKRGRYREAAQIQLQAATKSLNHASLWLRPHIGQVRALLKAPDVEQAVMMARQAIDIAETKMSAFNEQVGAANQELAANGSIVTPRLSPRVSVVATRMGYLFLQEGEPEVAGEFFERAIQSTKGGANRARQGLAKIALARGELGKALKMSADAIRRGGFKAKTISTWKTLIFARRQLGGWKIQESLIRGLDVAPARLRARTILSIVRELRKNDMRQWREVAEQWSTQEGAQFPIIETEIRKMILSSAKAEPGNATDKREKAESLLEMPGLSAKEWLTGAKELVRASLWEGSSVDIDQLVATAVGAYGQGFASRLRHSLALSCMMAKRHDLARPLLQTNIQTLAADKPQWGKSVWALARMESLLEDHATAAVLYREFFEENAMALHFRLQAQLLWCKELIAAGQPDALLEARTLMTASLSMVRDPDVLLNFARQLQFGPSELREWGQELFEEGKGYALQKFGAAVTPSRAISILFKLTRRQVCDFGRYDEVVEFWEGLSAEKRDWLWSEKSDFWTYLGQVFEAYSRKGDWEEAEALAHDYLDDPATPAAGIPFLGIPLARRMMQADRSTEGLELFRRLVHVAPTHPLCAEAWYWLALAAHKQENRYKVRVCATNIRIAQGTQVGLLSKWNLDAKAFLLLANLEIGAVDSQAVNYSPELLQEQLCNIYVDLKRLTI